MSNADLSHCEKCGAKTRSTHLHDGVLLCRECNLQEVGNHLIYLMEEAPELFFGAVKVKKTRK